jgi:hypothetical protein
MSFQVSKDNRDVILPDIVSAVQECLTHSSWRCSPEWLFLPGESHGNSVERNSWSYSCDSWRFVCSVSKAMSLYMKITKAVTTAEYSSCQLYAYTICFDNICHIFISVMMLYNIWLSFLQELKRLNVNFLFVSMEWILVLSCQSKDVLMQRDQFIFKGITGCYPFPSYTNIDLLFALIKNNMRS